MSPLPARPTLHDIALSVEQLHSCVEEERHLNSKHRDEVKQNFTDVQINFDRLNYVLGIRDVKTEDLHRVVKPARPITYRRIFTTVTGSITVVALVYKALVWLWPAVKLLLLQALSDFK